MVHFGSNKTGIKTLKKLVDIAKEMGLTAEFHIADSFANLQSILLDVHKDIVINPFY